MSIKNYFKIQELVDREVYSIHGDSAWKFIDEKLLKCLLIVRKGLDRSIKVNDWSFGGSMQQRGLRHNRSSMVIGKKSIYLSAHMMGKAVDFNVSGMESTEVRKWIQDNAELFPCKIRLENKLNGKPISWVHLDVIQEEKNPKVYLFNV